MPDVQSVLVAPLNFTPKAVFFDLDGTLIDSLPDIDAAINKAALSMGLAAPSHAKVQAWIGNGAGALVERVLADSIHIPAQRDPRYEALLEGYMQAYGELEHAYSHIYAGVESLLSYWQQQGVKLAVITNKATRFTPSILEHFGILHYFDEVYCGDTFAEKKPHPMPLLKACEAFSIEPSQALMVGDSRNDVGAAQNAGVACLAVRGGYNHGEDIALAKPTWIVDNLELV